MSAHEHTLDGHEPDLTLEVLRARISDEQNAGGPRTLHSIVRRLMSMTHSELEELVVMFPCSTIMIKQELEQPQQ